MMIKVILPPILLCSIAYASMPFASPSNNDLDTHYTFMPPDTSIFNTLTIGNDKETLLVGAKEKVFGLNLSDIRNKAFAPVTWRTEGANSCQYNAMNNDGRYCYNQIQVVQQLNETHLIICGSHSMSPKNRLLVRQNAQSNFAIEDPGLSFRLAFCSTNPDDPVTSLMVAGQENSSNIVATSRMQSGQKIRLIKSPHPETVFTNDVMDVKDAKFVASFLADDNTLFNHTMRKIYVVTAEDATEEKVDRQAPLPTVTQICANDEGGQDKLHKTWTSLLKLRLKCATTEKYPLVFDIVNDMVLVGNGLMYGTFMTAFETTRSHAVCSFRLEDIQKAFNGNAFWKVQGTKYSKVTAENLAPYRPGMCAYPGMNPINENEATSKDFPLNFLKFMSESFLLQGKVTSAFPSANVSRSPLTEGTLFVKTGGTFNKIAVQQVRNVTGAIHDIVFVGKDNGQIHKFFAMQKNDRIETVELALYQPTTDPIISMVLSPEKGQLYVGTATALHQISTMNCAAYTQSCEFCDPCSLCVLSRDPGCGWDVSKQRCVAIQNGLRSNIKQDIYYGEAASQCSPYPKASPPESKQASKGDSVILGHVVKSPTVKVLWYKYGSAGSSAKKQIIDVANKYSIQGDGQLKILNFDPSSDSAIYESHYTVNSTVLKKSAYKVSQSSGQGPLVTAPPVNPGKSNPDDTTGDSVPATGANETTTTAPLAFALSTFTVIGLVVALVLTLLLVVILIVVFKRRNSKFTPGRKSSDNVSSPRSKENTSANNNAGLTRIQSEYDDRANRPLLNGNQSPNQGDVEAGIVGASSSQRNARSLDNILDNRDDMQFADDDSSVSSEKLVTRKTSLREPSGRQRVPPTRTKSMPGSALYVVYGGKKLMCSTLQRSKQGTWTIEVKPNQSGMSDMAAEHDEEIIDIINEDGTKAEDKFTPSPDRKPSTSTIESASKVKMEDARKAFFEGKPDGSNSDRSPSIHYVASAPSRDISQKPKVAPKPPHVVERAASMRKPLPEKPSRASLRSYGRNSSEDRDSDSTIKGSVVTLKPDDSQSPLIKNSPFSSNDATKLDRRHQGDSGSVVHPVKTDAYAPLVGADLQKKSMRLPTSSDPVNYDGSSVSSDGDEQLHGRDSGFKKNVTPTDSPSKQSRTSHGSSSSGDYKSARSSVVSETTNDRR